MKVVTRCNGVWGNQAINSKPLISRCDDVLSTHTGGQVYFEDLTKTKATLVSAPGDAKGRKHPRLAITPNGDMLMVWTEGTGWQRGGSLAWHLFDRDGKLIGDTHIQPGVPVWSFAAVAANPNGFVVLY